MRDTRRLRTVHSVWGALGIVMALGLGACATGTQPGGGAEAPRTEAPSSDAPSSDAPHSHGGRPGQTGDAPPHTEAKAGSPAAAAVPSPADTSSRCGAWLQQQQAGEGRLYALDPAQTALRILVYRGGKLASLGHNHVIAAEQHAIGQIYVPKDGLSGAGAELGFRLDDMVLDSPAWRSAMGGDFARTLSEADIAGTRANMLKALEADQFPVVTVMTRTVEGGWPRPVLMLDVTLHGQTRTLALPVEASRPEGNQPVTAKGRVVLRQTDFGIRPFTVLGGLLAIQDPLVVELDLVARPASRCQRLPSAAGG